MSKIAVADAGFFVREEINSIVNAYMQTGLFSRRLAEKLAALELTPYSFYIRNLNNCAEVEKSLNVCSQNFSMLISVVWKTLL